ncbi:WD40-repeat-containing domain protein [Rhodocollybia butyracea]|uniref:WD40-repeat-containing domain protein n=1 Tax=Rhodocollybia butyracea TaxID=206335 RepID=A0A9P5QAU8_9AGAR|nr:WD40-repeat-containing domain protein [Rhodocollybia butyracea]
MSAPFTPPRTSHYNATASTSYTPPRSKSPSLSTSDFSLIGTDEAELEDYSYNTGTPYKGFGSFGRRAAIYSTPTLNYVSSSVPFPSSSPTQATNSGSSLKSLLPRIWDVLMSSPTKNIISTSRSSITPQTYTPPNEIHRHSMFSSYMSSSPSPVNRLTKGKGKASNYTSRSSQQMLADDSNDFWLHDDSFDCSSMRHSISSQYSYINYSDLPPLDGEEGELIDVDDEACFVPTDHYRYGGAMWRGGVKGSFSRARVVTGIDILTMLPTEIALYVFEFLAAGLSYTQPILSPYQLPRNSTLWSSQMSFLQDAVFTPGQSLQIILICASVSKTWRELALDNSVWRTLFEFRWGNGKSGGGITKDYVAIQEYLSNRRKATTGRDKELPALPVDSSSLTTPHEPEVSSLDYFKLYQDRLELDRRWAGTAFTRHVSADSTYSPSDSSIDIDFHVSRSSSLTPMYGTDHNLSVSSATVSSRSSLSTSTIRDIRDSRLVQSMPTILTEHWDKWEPDVMKLSGHSDSVYCIELPSSPAFAFDKIFITGSRDRTIKMWSANTAKCIGTFGRGRTFVSQETYDAQELELVDGHAGSVLCLKFIWKTEDEESDDSDDLDQIPDDFLDQENAIVRKGTMFSGSSDCTICVWDVYMAWSKSGQYKVDARVRTVLRGHSGGVLDLRVDDDWIVSCSKDTTIRVWNRRTLTPHRTLRGHEGPVNAVGMEDGRVVSASGDGKMILWDASSGERLRTFEGHDRGLACIEYSSGLIISGSSDWKIKIWSSFTGKCLRTLQGHEALVRALAFDPTSGLLVSASYDRSLRVWDIKDVMNGNVNETSRDGDKSLLRVFRNAHTSHIFDVKFDVGRIVSTSHDQKIVVADFSRGLETAHLFL